VFDTTPEAILNTRARTARLLVYRETQKLSIATHRIRQ